MMSIESVESILRAAADRAIDSGVHLIACDSLRKDGDTVSCCILNTVLLGTDGGTKSHSGDLWRPSAELLGISPEDTKAIMYGWDREDVSFASRSDYYLLGRKLADHYGV